MEPDAMSCQSARVLWLSMSVGKKTDTDTLVLHGKDERMKVRKYTCDVSEPAF